MNRYASHAIALVVGLIISWAWYSPSTKTEAPAAAARQADGSLVLERTATNQKATPAHAIPKGGKAERVVRVDVQPTRADCPVCTVDLTLVRMPDASRRVVASSPTGTVLSGLDIPVLPITVERSRPWAAGAMYNGRWGAVVTRDFRWLSAGGAVTEERDGSYAQWAVLMFRF
jgi:hypothetical protein